jgi:HAD-hyrolase-like
MEIAEIAGTLSKMPARNESSLASDVVWATLHDFARIGMGALCASLEAMFKVITGKELKIIAFGKPQLGTFEFATRLLQQWRKDNYGISSPPDTVYFVDDTPESDIQVMNEFDESDNSTNWYSILVRTGVFRERTKPNYFLKITVDSVLDAVKYSMQRKSTKTVKTNSIFALFAEDSKSNNYGRQNIFKDKKYEDLRDLSTLTKRINNKDLFK